MQPILVTGGAGFIGSEFVRQWVALERSAVINLDALTYAGNLDSLALVTHDPRYFFVQGSIGEDSLVRALPGEHRPRAIVNFAAESHVDRSIDGPAIFVETNVVGTFRLLEETRHYWSDLPEQERRDFRFLHVSTDKFSGSLGPTGKFTETTPLPVYGDGGQIRDGLYVADHCRAIRLVLERGRVGEVSNIGGDCERTNPEVVETICRAVDEIALGEEREGHARLITHVTDHPGHDRRYAIDFDKLKQEFGWQPSKTFVSGVAKTVDWFLGNNAAGKTKVVDAARSRRGVVTANLGF
ncbi:MAG: GDP-mannose 4,6-dehydratase [Planctomycetia bacterium]|nr:GDP-mannose 4,6-dehydratase [Planctomycetia bacterium]